MITHAHLDHCGYLPVLVRAGWRGPVYTNAGTAKLVSFVLADSAHLMAEEAAHANTDGWSKHDRALPLYDEHDAARAMRVYRLGLAEHWGEVRPALADAADPFDPGHLAELRHDRGVDDRQPPPAAVDRVLGVGHGHWRPDPAPH